MSIRRVFRVRRVFGYAGLLAALCACHPTPGATPTPQMPSSGSQSGPTSLPSATADTAPAAAATALGTPAVVEGEDEYLVVTQANELVLRTREHVVRVLASGVRGALYDQKLELVWLEGDSLRVLDLRKPESKPISIVRNWPGTSMLQIEHPSSHVSNNDSCDVGDMATLHWGTRPTLDVIADEDRELPLESKEWLKAELTRAPRKLPDPAETDLRQVETRVALPAKLAHCQDSQECGRAVRFGGYDLQLVLSVTAQADCWHPFCLFRDPKSGAISSPALGARWRAAGELSGPCGYYQFDRSGKSFLVGDRLCGAGERCQDAGGYIVGWRQPGALVGAPNEGTMGPNEKELKEMDDERAHERDGAGEEEGEGE